MSDKTLFSKIIDREIPSKIAYEDDDCIALHDINPQAPVHVLIIPKKPIPRLTEATANDQALLGKLMLTAASLARQLELDQGFRVVINNGPFGGESVPHLHVHLLGKRPLRWPPG
ncbi:MAG TPA: histidine triad nucleotide-binding protein [Opitutales bacterium]|nr:histidine triad nucleotide-binding protein [Opitutales bacterium]